MADSPSAPQPPAPDAPIDPTPSEPASPGWPSAEADQDIDLAGTEADEPPIGEALEPEHRRRHTDRPASEPRPH